MEKPCIKVKAEMFPEIVGKYNNDGKSAAYSLIRSSFGVKNPWHIVDRIKKCGKYRYDVDHDRFIPVNSEMSENIFLDLKTLCKGGSIESQKMSDSISDNRMSAMEKLVQELIGDRLLTLSRYISLDSASRTIIIDQTSMASDGYSVMTH